MVTRALDLPIDAISCDRPARQYGSIAIAEYQFAPDELFEFLPPYEPQPWLTRRTHPAYSVQRLAERLWHERSRLIRHRQNIHSHTGHHQTSLLLTPPASLRTENSKLKTVFQLPQRPSIRISAVIPCGLIYSCILY